MLHTSGFKVWSQASILSVTWELVRYANYLAISETIFGKSPGILTLTLRTTTVHAQTSEGAPASRPLCWVLTQ